MTVSCSKNVKNLHLIFIYAFICQTKAPRPSKLSAQCMKDQEMRYKQLLDALIKSL